MCKQINFQIFLLFAIEMAVLSVFSQKKSLGPLGVNLIPPDTLPRMERVYPRKIQHSEPYDGIPAKCTDLSLNCIFTFY